MSYKLVRSFESSVSWLAKNRNYQSSKMQKMSSRMPCTQEPWVLWPAKNCTICFMTPQKSHFQATKMQKMNSYKGMFPWPWLSRLGKIALSGLKNEENLLKLSEVPLNSGLHDSAKIAFSCSQNAENELTRKYVPLNRLFKDSAEIAFSGRQSAENELTRS